MDSIVRRRAHRRRPGRQARCRRSLDAAGGRMDRIRRAGPVRIAGATHGCRAGSPAVHRYRARRHADRCRRRAVRGIAGAVSNATHPGLRRHRVAGRYRSRGRHRRARLHRRPRAARGPRADGRHRPLPGRGEKPVMVAVRIIPCLDVRSGRVVKGVKFRDHVDMGDIIERAQAYRDQGADELVFYDITASPERRSVDVEWVARVAAEIDIPFAVAGGIRDVDRARAVLHAGADKISINSPALKRPALVRELADTFGSQCVVIGIDSIRENGRYRLRANTGDPDNMIDPDLDTRAWVEQVQRLGAGEIVLNCMDADGVRTGYDIEQLAEMRAICDVPLIASGGAGAREHFLEAFQRADVDGALAATVFHSGQIPIPALKEWLSAQGIETRLQAGSTAPVQ